MKQVLKNKAIPHSNFHLLSVIALIRMVKISSRHLILFGAGKIG